MIIFRFLLLAFLMKSSQTFDGLLVEGFTKSALEGLVHESPVSVDTILIGNDEKQELYSSRNKADLDLNPTEALNEPFLSLLFSPEFIKDSFKITPESVEGSMDVLLDSRDTFLKAQLNTFNAFITNTSYRRQKYVDMTEDKLAFFRATAHIFYKDLNLNQIISIPSSWKSPSTSSLSSCSTLPSQTCAPRTWIGGDAHTQNVGFFDNNQGIVKFDLNDFDDCYIAPFYWDLLRFSISIFLHQGLVSGKVLQCSHIFTVRNQFTVSDGYIYVYSGWSLSTSEAQSAVTDFLNYYETALSDVNGNKDELTIELTSSATGSNFVNDEVVYLAVIKSQATLLASKTTLSGSVRTITRIANSVIDVGSEWSDVENKWSTYVSSLSSVTNLRGMTIKDKARRIDSGLGSRGVLRFLVLIEGPTLRNTDDILLDVKEQRQPSVFQEGSLSTTEYSTWFSSHADRTKTCLKGVLLNSDNFAAAIEGSSKNYLVRSVSPYKHECDPSHFSYKSDLLDFVKYAGRAYAYAHARSDKDYNTNFVAYNFEQSYACCIDYWPNFKTQVNSFAQTYASQVATDYTKFLSWYTTLS